MLSALRELGVTVSIDDYGTGLSTLEYASMFASLTTNVADATIGIFDAKYTYDYWRPVTGIRGGDIDGNPDSTADAGWTSLIRL